MPETASPTLTADQQIQRNFRWNFIVNAIDGASYWFGYSFISPAIILPLYISHFTNNPIIIGLIPFLGTAGFLLPQLFTSNWVERSPLKKFFPVNIGFFTERVPVFLMAPAAFFFAKSNPALALALFIILYAWYGFGAGTIIVGWQDLVAKIIPVEKRGRFFGITNFIGSAAGILGAAVVPLVLQRYAFPTGYVMSFIAASALILISWIALSLTREPPVANTKPVVSQTEYFRSLPAIIRSDPNFSRYLISQIILAFSAMGAGFLAVYSAQHWNQPDSQAAGYIIAMQIGTAIANPVVGFLADRKGHKLSMELSILLGTLAFGLAFVAPGPLWFYPIFFLRGWVMAGTMITSMTLVMEFTTPEHRPTYFGLANTIPGVASSIAPLIGGWLAGLAGYPLIFLISTIFGVAGLVMLRWGVKDPRHVEKVVNSQQLTVNS
jgi:MFS family permease